MYELFQDLITNSLLDICDSEWIYFDGFCYFTSDTCADWTAAVKKCRQENSVLIDVNNNEENVYMQHRHNGEKSWVGLNDRSTEGDFTWVDRAHGNFTVWATNQPNNFKEEDCVHALGVKYNYKWNDVQCSDCHQFTCKKGKSNILNEAFTISFSRANLINVFQWLVWCYLCSDSVLFGLILILET